MLFRSRIYFDSESDDYVAKPNNDDKSPNYVDVGANGGTLVLFESNKFPHEVLDTRKERYAIAGWYNRPVSLSDISALSGGENNSNNGGSANASNDIASDPIRLIGLAVAAGLVTVGVIDLLSAS